MKVFTFSPPPLERISDHAGLFSSGESRRIDRTIRNLQRGFPQLRWRVATVELKEEEDIGLFAFWLLNVSPLAEDEDILDRPWTILFVLEKDRDMAVAPGYAAEIWLSGDQWEGMLRASGGKMRSRSMGEAVVAMLEKCALDLRISWSKAQESTSRGVRKSVVQS